jgi:anaerobic selenocysteine-containing dehydrogenase
MPIVPSICRSCTAFCPILVDVEDGRVRKVSGDPDAVHYQGYTCPKGRALPEQINDPERLLHSIKRCSNGSFAAIASDAAVTEIADKLKDIIAEHGPRSVAMYLGNGSGLQHPFSAIMAMVLFREIGSPMVFTAATIDKPAEKIVAAMHGYWMGGAQAFADADTWLLIGGNPIISKSNGLPYNNPAMRLKEAVGRGLKLLVVDPRHTECARRAHIHLQAKPGEDPTILAGLIRVIIDESLYDAAFVADHVSGFDALRVAVEPFTPEYVAERAGISADDLVATARCFGGAARGMAVCSTGPSFSTHSNAAFYLTLCLNSICGRWVREGERAVYPNVLLPAYTPKAQAIGPYPIFGDTEMRVMGLRESVAGMPTAALADEILTPGDGQVRALICLGGNPALAFPDQEKTERALSALDLLVTLDVTLSATARLGHYVIAAPMPLELPALTYLPETLKYIAQGRGLQIPWAQYTPPAAPPPLGSDLLVEHAFFFRLAKRMGYSLTWVNYHGLGKFIEAPTEMVPFDMDVEPSLDDLFELATRSARVPLAEVKAHPHGHCFDVDVVVAARDPGYSERLDVGNALIMEELATIREAVLEPLNNDANYPFRLVCRRANTSMNSIGSTTPSLMKGRYFNPLTIHPLDAATLGLADDCVVEVCSRHGAVHAVVEHDPTLRRGVVAMTHGFGSVPGSDPRSGGSNVNLLYHVAEYDWISGIPRMSALPVNIRRIDATVKETGLVSTAM